MIESVEIMMSKISPSELQGELSIMRSTGPMKVYVNEHPVSGKGADVSFALVYRGSRTFGMLTVNKTKTKTECCCVAKSRVTDLKLMICS